MAEKDKKNKKKKQEGVLDKAEKPIDEKPRKHENGAAPTPDMEKQEVPLDPSDKEIPLDKVTDKPGPPANIDSAGVRIKTPHEEEDDKKEDQTVPKKQK